MKPWLVTVLPLVTVTPPSKTMAIVLAVVCVVAVVWAIRDGRQS